MKDERGHYYYPFPQNKRVHMYVREAEGAIWFRLWNAEDEKLWDEHGWLAYDAIRKAARIYREGISTLNGHTTSILRRRCFVKGSDRPSPRQPPAAGGSDRMCNHGVERAATAGP